MNIHIVPSGNHIVPSGNNVYNVTITSSVLPICLCSMHPVHVGTSVDIDINEDASSLAQITNPWNKYKLPRLSKPCQFH